jgi:hypothetical protein
LSYKGSNNSGRLRIKTGDLKRSLEKRGGKGDGAIRQLTIKKQMVRGEIGTSVASDDGFSYPYFHEYGRFPFLMPSILQEQSSFKRRFDKHWKKVKL